MVKTSAKVLITAYALTKNSVHGGLANNSLLKSTNISFVFAHGKLKVVSDRQNNQVLLRQYCVYEVSNETNSLKESMFNTRIEHRWFETVIPIK